VGAVGYLNARPLVCGLAEHERFDLRFDVPSVCSGLLHAGEIDIGLIPSIEYLARPDYRLVPGVAVTSTGPVDSVALFTTRPVAAIRTIALDSSSRTSAALLRVLCARAFEIDPTFVTRGPDLSAMLGEADAALLIGDVALFIEPEAWGVTKIDLGAEWTAMTGLPFVWAFWVGRPDALAPDDVQALQRARDRGEAAREAIAREYYRGEPARIDRAVAYLEHNIKCRMDSAQYAGLRRFYREAADIGLVARPEELRFFVERVEHTPSGAGRV
jgi:chorismate dehydratase